jgi:hypothetical protein
MLPEKFIELYSTPELLFDSAGYIEECLMLKPEENNELEI